MKSRKKILSIIIKLLIGIGSVLVIYWRLRHDLTVDKLGLLSSSLVSLKGVLCLVAALALMPLNWGIESFKWQQITAPVEKISLGRAIRSVYSGVCLGNFAPGRATEFVAKILFFKNENRPKVTILHFMNGMFQFSITVVLGFLALLVKLQDFGGQYSWLIYVSGSIGAVMISVLALCIIKVDVILNSVSKRLSKQNHVDGFNYQFSGSRIVTLFGFSGLRYLVFFSQFALVLSVFHSQVFSLPVLSGISIYFLITSTIPMFSMVEAAIRAAVALVVFKGCGMSDTVIALCTVLIWLINIILPSLAGYYFLVRENFNFKFLSDKK
ncbi:MAG: hypothetical protein IT236_16140 [Bacteroidia bacterium]|nr:hypothetical protein [Bacteroidia bacterium]